MSEEEVEYIIVGGYAVIFHSQPRFTKDLEIWLKPTTENAEKVLRVFAQFGLPLLGNVTVSDFASEGFQYAIDRPPSMIDFLTSIPGLEFEPCWKRRVTADESGFAMLFLSKSDLVTAKKEAGRLQDLADIEELNRTDP